MKFFMENKKKQGMYLGVIILSLGFMVWIWTGGRSKVPSVDPVDISNAMLGSGTTPSANTAAGSLLPYGTEFDTGLLSDPAFLRLKSKPKLQVFSEDLGVDNPFLSP